jgi:hypothetical protein
MVNRHRLSAVVGAVQIRGSIPLYWVQDTTSVSPINPKPAIQLQQYDPHYSATRLHFQVKLSARFMRIRFGGHTAIILVVTVSNTAY